MVRFGKKVAVLTLAGALAAMSVTMWFYKRRCNSSNGWR